MAGDGSISWVEDDPKLMAIKVLSLDRFRIRSENCCRITATCWEDLLDMRALNLQNFQGYFSEKIAGEMTV
ncbi:hypothetical protein SUGI_0423450 [Cryptomeria japonica]|nr:hypothetical protein SUGI_0423450 [Cryptomeria japonica]